MSGIANAPAPRPMGRDAGALVLLAQFQVLAAQLVLARPEPCHVLSVHDRAFQPASLQV